MPELPILFTRNRGIMTVTPENTSTKKATKTALTNSFSMPGHRNIIIVNLVLHVFQECHEWAQSTGSKEACLCDVAVDGCGGNTRTAVTIYTDGENIISAFLVDTCLKK